MALIPILAVSVPRGIIWIPGIAGVVLFLIYSLLLKERVVFSKSTFLAAGILSVLALVSSLWAIDPQDSFQRACHVTVTLLSCSFLINMALSVKIEDIKPTLWVLPAALFISALLIFIELKTGSSFYRLVRHIPADTRVKPSEYNRAAVIVTVLFFPCMAILRNYLRWPMILGLILIGLGPMLVTTDSQSVQMALILGLITFAAFPYRWKPAWYIATIAIVSLMLAAPFLSIWIFHHWADTINTLPLVGSGGGYAGARLEIWDYVSRYMLHRPLIGFGFESTRQVTHFDSHEIFQKTTIILHPHNFVIQIWMEFGLLGILMTGAMFAALLLSMQKNLTPAQARMALPTLIASMSIASTGFGLWQGWWIATLFTAAATCLLAIRMNPSSSTQDAE